MHINNCMVINIVVCQHHDQAFSFSVWQNIWTILFLLFLFFLSVGSLFCICKYSENMNLFYKSTIFLLFICAKYWLLNYTIKRTIKSCLSFTVLNPFLFLVFPMCFMHCPISYILLPFIWGIHFPCLMSLLEFLNSISFPTICLSVVSGIWSYTVNQLIIF